MRTFPLCECLEAIDPGKHKCYSSFSVDYRIVLLGCYALDTEQRAIWTTFSGPKGPLNPEVTVIEKPTLYQGHPRPNDVLDLAWNGAIVLGQVIALQRSEAYWPDRPSAWKANRAKFKHHRAIWEKVFTDYERALFPADTYDYIIAACKAFAADKKPTYDKEIVNYLDAAALNVTALGRCGVGGRTRRSR